MPTALESGNRHPAKRIAIFNHKGGVGKTTLTVNVADALAGQGKRVLLVDSDPQCNLTSYLVEESVVDDLLDNSDSPHGRTIWSGVKPVVDGLGHVKEVTPIEWMTNISLLPGDIQLSEFELELGQFWNECFQRKQKGFRGTTALSSIVDNTCRAISADFVFYDAGPNIGSLNRVILLDCDYFIIPAACDLFSIRALKTLGHTLSTWVTDWQTIADLAPESTYLLPGGPKFLGYIPQRFRIYRGGLSSDYARYLPKIEHGISSDVIEVLRRTNPLLVPPTSTGNQLGQIKDFGSLAAASQIQGVPIKNVQAGTPDQREVARADFAEIASNIIQLTGGS